MNKLGKFIAAGVAALCAFSAEAMLPVEYQEVEYIESTGTQYLDTGVVIGENHELQFKYAMLTCKEYRGPFGTYVNENANATRVMANNGSQTDLLVNFMTKAGGGGTTFQGVTKAAGEVVEGYMNLTNASFNGVEKALSRTTLGSVDSSTMKLLGRSGYATSIRLYYFRILDGGELVHDYVPCYLRSDSSKVGLYDVIGNTFFSADNLLKGAEVYHADALAIAGFPENFDKVVPDYGSYGGYSVGQSFTCSAPAAWTNLDETIVATCIGYKVYTNDVVYVEGNGNSFTYTHPACEKGAKLVWQWKKYRRVTVAVAGGADEPTVMYAADGDAITAPTVAGKTFSHWSGDIANLPRFEATVRQTDDVNRALVANYVDDEPEAAENTYTGAKDGKWNVDGNWSLGHIPTASEIAIVPTGKGTVIIEDSAVCAKLVINNDVKVRLDGTANTPNGQPRLDVLGDAVIAANGLQLGNGVASVYQPYLYVGGDLMVSNNNRTAYFDVYAGDPYGTNTKELIAAGYTGEHPPREAEYQRGGAWVNVKGRLFLGGRHASNTSQIRVWSHRYTGMSAVFTVGSFLTDTHGYVDVASSTGADGCKGWRSTSDGYYGIGVAAKNGGGASYGGLGGHTSENDLSTMGKTYGYAYAPFWCGSSQSRGGTDGGHGGGLFRLHAAGAVELNCTITANGASWGSNANRGGGSGGGVWITCETFTPGASAMITAKGGGHSVDNGAAGGGGRVAVATGCISASDIDSFLTTGACDGFVATDFALTDYPSLVSVAGGRNTNIDTYNPGTKPWLHGCDGTAFLVQNARGAAPLTVTATPYRLGAANPSLATHVVPEGDTVCTEDEIVFVEGSDDKTRLHLQGAVWTNAVANGTLTGASGSVPVNGATTLVWQYGDMEHRLVATSGGYGTISSFDKWQDDGKEVTLTATPAEGCTFVRWEGDVAAADKTSASITFTMKAPKRLVAIFANPSAEPRDFTFAGTGDWYDLANWDGAAIPTAKDAVTVTGNATLPLAAQVDVGTLIVSAGTLSFDLARDADAKLAIAGDLTVANGAKISLGALKRTSRADLEVGGTLALNGTGTIEVFAGEGAEATPGWQAFKAGGSAVNAGVLALNDTSKLLVHAARYSGLPVVCVVTGDVTVAEGARIAGSNYTADNNCFGWGWESPKGLGYDSAGKGGAYGGIGGNSNTKTNGWVYAPFYPGSPGSYRSDNRGQGGGAVRIAAGGKVTLNGKIYVTGGHNENMSNHAGSGGGVWITCAEFAPGENALIHARGGRSNQHGGAYAGGGGRVAIMTGSPSEAQIDSLYETGACVDLLVVAEDMNDAVASPWPNLVNVQGGVNNDNAANASYFGHGKPGTAVLLKNSYGQSVVTIDGNVPTTETTPAYGTTSVDRGERTFTAPKYIYSEDGLSRYECLGWEWEDTNGNSGSGETTSATLDVQADTDFTWKWSGIQYKLTVRSGGYGTVAWNGGEEWYASGATVTLTETPAADCTFDRWVGEFDYANGANKAATLTLTMDRPREVVALFQSAAPRTLTWNMGGTTDWFDKANWDGEAVPSALDAVCFTGGTFQVKFPFEMRVASWTQGAGTVGFVGTEMTIKSNSFNDNTVNYVLPLDAADTRLYSLAVSGDMTLNGKSTKLWFGGVNAAARHDVTVGGNFTMGDTAAFELYAGGTANLADPTTFAAGGAKLTVGGNMTLDGSAVFYPCCHIETGAPVVMEVAQTATIGEKATINANVRGYGRRVWNPGTGWYAICFGPGAATNEAQTNEPDRKGGTYGGLGGRVSASLFPNGVGYLLAPYLPGSAGIVRPSYGEIFSGGGAVRINAQKIILNGKITANGDGQYCRAGGSGGGVWLTSRKFELGEKGKISANGGRCNNYGATGGGGGGRIAVMLKATSYQIDRLYSKGTLSGAAYENLADLEEWAGHFDVAGGIGGDGTDYGTSGTAVFMIAPASGTSLIMR